MKKSILTLSLLLLALSAGAWNKLTLPVITALTAQHLTPKAAKATKAALGSNFAECDITNRKKYLFNLDEEYAPISIGSNDAITVINESIERLKSNKNDDEAILALARAVADMHSVANIRIKGHEFSNKDFQIRRWNNRDGRMARYKNSSWRFLWNSYYSSRHRIMTPELYAEDTDIYSGARRSDYMQGNLDSWAADIAKESRAVYSRKLVDEQIFRQEEINEFEFIHDRLMAKAAYRLAAVLNNIYK